VDRVVGVSQERIGEAGLEQIHGEEGGNLYDLMKKNINRLSVLSLLRTGLLAEAKEAGAGEGQKLLEPVFSVVVAAEGEEAAQQLVHRHRQAVDVVRVALKLGLVHAGLAFGQLWDGDRDEHHQQARR